MLESIAPPAFSIPTVSCQRAARLRRWLFLLGGLFLVGSQTAVLLYLAAHSHSLRQLKDDVRSVRTEVDRARREILSASIAEVTDRLVGDAVSPQDKCLRIARWVAGHLSNERDAGLDQFGGFALRSGFCGVRSGLFVEMLRQLHIPARPFGIYDMGGPGGGHSCAQAYYDDQWHFFDLTYAGVFMRGGKVLSWEEIHADPEAAVRDMVVFPTTLDRYGAPGDDPLTRAPVTNEVRMHAAYLPETIRNATCTGFVGGPDVKLQQLVLSSASLAQPLRIGKLDRSGEDVNEEAVRLHLGEYLGCLGTIADTLQHLWCFENCPAGKHFTVRYQVTRASHPELHFWARGHNATLDAEEQTFVTSPALMGDGTGVWEIDFTSVTAGNVGLEIGYDFREPHRGMIVDQIEVLER